MLKGITFYVVLFILLISPKLFGETITTGNLLSNSGFTGGNTSWTNHGTTQQHHVGMGNECSGSAVDNSNSGCGVSGSLATLDNGGVSQTIKLSEKTNMTQAEINNGFSSTMSNDIWFWHGEDTVTMKQELTDSAGNTTTQQRIVVGSHNNYQTYTDKVIIGTNTSTDYDIKAQLDIDDSANCSSHCGPDIDNVELKVSYTYINPIDDTTQDVIDDIDTDIVDIIDDIPEDFDWYNDDIVFDDTYTWEEDEYTWEEDFYFEEEYTMEEDVYFEEFEMEEFDIVDFESPPIFEDSFEEIDFEEMPTMEDVFFEETYIEPPMMTEEIFTEEFEEDFTSFIEETGMEEEFMEFLEDEGITAEEFFEEIAEEEFDDEFTEESFEEFEEEMVESSINEESVPEIIEDKEEAMEEPNADEEPIEEEVANNENTREEESTEEDEPSSEGTEESSVQAEDSEEQDSVQSEGRDKVDTNGRVIADVGKVESKLKQNLKKIAKQIAKVTKETTQNLTKEDLFFKNNTLNAYNKVQFYKSKDIYKDQGLDLFNQLDLGVYNQEIYGGVTLASYTQNDPVEVHRVQLQEAVSKTKRLQLELEAMKK